MANHITKSGADEELVSSGKLHDHNVIESSKDASQNSEMLHNAAFTEEELVLEKKLRRKLDLIIMPLMVWT